MAAKTNFANNSSDLSSVAKVKNQMNESLVSVRPVIVDTDCGIDDALAIAFLWAAGFEEQVLLFTTVAGNSTAAQSAHNVRALLRLLGWHNTSIVAGSESTLQGFPFDTGELVHGSDGMGGVVGPTQKQNLVSDTSDETAARQIINLSHTFPGLDLICLGPLTNIARALILDPSLPERVNAVTAMGGAIHHSGNGTPAAEANIRNDPHAAHAVLNANWSVTLVPLDATMAHRIDERDARMLQNSTNPGIMLIGQALPTYLHFHRGRYFNNAEGVLHDPLTAAIALNFLNGVYAPRLRVEVDTRLGPTYGMTIGDTRNRYLGYPERGDENTFVVLNVTDAFSNTLTDLLIERK